MITTVVLRPKAVARCGDLDSDHIAAVPLLEWHAPPGVGIFKLQTAGLISTARDPTYAISRFLIAFADALQSSATAPPAVNGARVMTRSPSAKG